MAFKVSSTIVVNNSAQVPAGVIPDVPATMPTNVSITGPAGGGNPYAIATLTGATGAPNSYAAAYRVSISGNVLYLT